MGRFIKNFFLVACLIGLGSVVAQENDDLYYTKSDRNKEQNKLEEMRSKWYASQYPEEENQKSEVKRSQATSFLGKQYQYIPEEELLDESVRQGLMDDYKPEKTIEDYTSNTGPSSYTLYNEEETSLEDSPNQNYSDPQNTYQNDPVIVNNYYNNDGWNNWNRWNAGFGWNNWGGNFWNISYGWGGWYDPFWDPFWGYNWGWNAGWGWNSWGWNGWGWGGGFYGSGWYQPYGGYYNSPVYVVSDYRYRRNIIRSPRNTRGGAVSSSGRSSSRTTAVANERTGTRSYARQQRDYLNQSRSSRYSNASNARTSGNYSNVRNSSSRTTRNNSSVNRGSSTRNSAYGNSSRTSHSGGSTYQRSSSSGSNRSSGYSRPSSGSSRGRSAGSVRSSSSRGSSSGRSSSGRSSSGRSGSRRGN